MGRTEPREAKRRTFRIGLHYIGSARFNKSSILASVPIADTIPWGPAHSGQGRLPAGALTGPGLDRRLRRQALPDFLVSRFDPERPVGIQAAAILAIQVKKNIPGTVLADNLDVAEILYENCLCSAHK